MENKVQLDDSQKQLIREALQHMKNGMDKLREFEGEAASEMKTSVTDGIAQVEAGLRTALEGVAASTDGTFDPANELRGAYGNTYETAGGGRVAGKAGATGNEFPDQNETPATQTAGQQMSGTQSGTGTQGGTNAEETDEEKSM